MGWSTLYVHGKPGFEEEVLEQLERSSIGFMPGSVSGEENISLYWVDERTNTRDFKKAIGRDIVFRYRLRVFKSLEEVHAFQDERLASQFFTPQEEALIREMEHWDETHPNHQHYKHSA
ncbi:MAG: hypothetical protein E6Q96_01405 [Cyclobacteriaceae bacterium]|nr:MAG: hypothetical protein E6Q96_01405 [Cyclobacteriaceae bacterium]